MTPLRTVIAHPGATSLLYPLVAALQSIDKATEFHTGLYFDLDGPWARILARLPTPLADRLRREMGRRYRPGISAAKIRRHRLGELVYLLAMRCLLYTSDAADE